MLEFATPSLSTRQSMPVDYATYLLSSSPPPNTFDLLSVAFSPLTIHNDAGDQLAGGCSRGKGRPRLSPLKPIIIRSDSDEGLSVSSDDSAPQSPESPRSPGRNKKKVSFADLRGQALATVRLITEPSDLPPKLNPGILSSITQGAYADVTEQPPLKLLFSQPASDYMAFRDKVEKSCVCLENVILKDYDVIGTIKVKNVCFEKKVFLRCSFDNWKSFTDVLAKFVPGPGETSGRPNIFDTFSFEFSIPTDLDRNQKIEFAVCFETPDGQYWDNDNGSNYQIVFSDFKSKESFESVSGLQNAPAWTEYKWNQEDTHPTYY